MATTLRFTDDFDGSGDLNGSAVGATAATWTAVSGTWSRSGGLAVTTAAASTNPILATDLAEADADITLNGYTGAGGGDALYFRVADAQNWWRLRQRVQRVTTTYQSGWQGTGWVYSRTYDYGSATAGQYHDAYQDYVNGIPTKWYHVIYSGSGSSMTARADLYVQSVVPTYSSTTSTYRYLVLEKCVAGAVSTMDSWTVSSFNQLRIVAAGDVIQYFEPDGLTVHASITDAANDTATRHGLGLGGSDNSVTGSGLTTWVGQLHGSNAVPSILYPLGGADVEFATGFALQVQTNYPPGDVATAIDIRWRAQGAADWTEVDGALTTSGAWPFPLSGLTPPVQIEVQARATDSFAAVSDWSGSTFFTFRVRPTPPAFVAPASGGLVTALQVAIVNFDTDGVPASLMVARRVADGGSGPNENTVYQDYLPLTRLDDGTYALVGDGVTHITGTEYVQAHRQTEAGGSLWSEWASLLVTEEVAQPAPPLVTWVPLADDGALAFTLTPQPSDPLHKATVRMEVARDGERIFSAGVADDPVSFTDAYAGPNSNYTFTAVADDETKAQVS